MRDFVVRGPFLRCHPSFIFCWQWPRTFRHSYTTQELQSTFFGVAHHRHDVLSHGSGCKGPFQCRGFSAHDGEQAINCRCCDEKNTLKATVPKREQRTAADVIVYTKISILFHQSLEKLYKVGFHVEDAAYTTGNRTVQRTTSRMPTRFPHTIQYIQQPGHILLHATNPSPKHVKHEEPISSAERLILAMRANRCVQPRTPGGYSSRSLLQTTCTISKPLVQPRHPHPLDHLRDRSS